MIIGFLALLLAVRMTPDFSLIILSYIVLNLLYSFWLKHIFIIDIFSHRFRFYTPCYGRECCPGSIALSMAFYSDISPCAHPWFRQKSSRVIPFKFSFRKILCFCHSFLFLNPTISFNRINISVESNSYMNAIAIFLGEYFAFAFCFLINEINTDCPPKI